MATPLPGPPATSSHEGLPGGREDFLRMVMAPGLGQLDDDILHSFLGPVPSGSIPSLSGCLKDGQAAQLSAPHGFHMDPTCQVMPPHAPLSAAHLAVPGPHATGVSQANPPGTGGWGYLDVFQGDAMPFGPFASGMPALPVLAMGPASLPVGGPAWETPASPSVGSVKLRSPEHSQTGTLGDRAGSGGSGGAPAADPDLFHKEKQRLAQKRFRERQKVRWGIEPGSAGVPVP